MSGTKLGIEGGCSDGGEKGGGSDSGSGDGGGDDDDGAGGAQGCLGRKNRPGVARRSCFVRLGYAQGLLAGCLQVATTCAFVVKTRRTRS